MARYFLDTNILVYAHDRNSGAKHKRARDLVEELWNSGEGILSTQVLQEFCITLRRKVFPPVPVEEVRSLIRDYLNWEIVVNRPESILEALSIEERHKISFWDALILQAAEASNATLLYSEDLAAGQVYGTVQVVNPFRD